MGETEKILVGNWLMEIDKNALKKLAKRGLMSTDDDDMKDLLMDLIEIEQKLLWFENNVEMSGNRKAGTLLPRNKETLQFMKDELKMSVEETQAGDPIPYEEIQPYIDWLELKEAELLANLTPVFQALLADENIQALLRAVSRKRQPQAEPPKEEVEENAEEKEAEE